MESSSIVEIVFAGLKSCRMATAVGRLRRYPPNPQVDNAINLFTTLFVFQIFCQSSNFNRMLKFGAFLYQRLSFNSSYFFNMVLFIKQNHFVQILFCACFLFYVTIFWNRNLFFITWIGNHLIVVEKATRLSQIRPIWFRFINQNDFEWRHFVVLGIWYVINSTCFIFSARKFTDRAQLFCTNLFEHHNHHVVITIEYFNALSRWLFVFVICFCCHGICNTLSFRIVICICCNQHEWYPFLCIIYTK